MAHREATAMSFGSSFGLAMVLMSMFWARAVAQNSCTNTLISMSPCLNYITGNSSTPSSQCCTQLASVVRSSPECLCQVLNGGGPSLGVNINQTLALALPGACNVQTPPLSRCNANSPAASPAGTPGDQTPTTTSGTPGSKSTPSTDTDGTSDGNSVKLSIALLAVLFAACSSLFTAF